MLRKTVLLMLTLLLVAMPVLAGGSSSYTLVPDGVVFDVFFLDGGDIMQYGSFGRQAENGRYGDSLVRSKPDGTEVWSLTLPYPPEEAGVISQLLPLSDGRHLMIHALEADDLRGFFVDLKDGTTTEIALPYGEQQYFAVNDGLIEAGVTSGKDGIYLRWMNLDGLESMYKEYPVKHAEEMYLHLLEAEDGFYLLAQASPGTEDAESVLMKITGEGLLQWKQTDDTRHGFGATLRSDGAGGVLLMAYQGMYDETTNYPYRARRIDAQGNTVWEKEVEVGTWLVQNHGGTDAGISMTWEADDVFQLVTLTPDGELEKSEAYEKPVVNEDVSCNISGCATDMEGQQWVYYLTVQEIDMHTTEVQSFMRQLSTFPLSSQAIGRVPF